MEGERGGGGRERERREREERERVLKILSHFFVAAVQVW